jgi:plasmid stabilization system protein ParE
VSPPYALEYLPAAAQDLLDILDYIITRDNPGAARTFVDRVERAIGRLSAFPRSGREPRDARRAAQIRRVIHGARRYEFLLPDR